MKTFGLQLVLKNMIKDVYSLICDWKRKRLVPPSQSGMPTTKTDFKLRL